MATPVRSQANGRTAFQSRQSKRAESLREQREREKAVAQQLAALRKQEEARERQRLEAENRRYGGLTVKEYNELVSRYGEGGRRTPISRADSKFRRELQSKLNAFRKAYGLEGSVVVTARGISGGGTTYLKTSQGMAEFKPGATYGTIIQPTVSQKQPSIADNPDLIASSVEGKDVFITKGGGLATTNPAKVRVPSNAIGSRADGGFIVQQPGKNPAQLRDVFYQPLRTVRPEEVASLAPARKPQQAVYRETPQQSYEQNIFTQTQRNLRDVASNPKNNPFQQFVAQVGAYGLTPFAYSAEVGIATREGGVRGGLTRAQKPLVELQTSAVNLVGNLVRDPQGTIVGGARDATTQFVSNLQTTPGRATADLSIFVGETLALNYGLLKVRNPLTVRTGQNTPAMTNQIVTADFLKSKNVPAVRNTFLTQEFSVRPIERVQGVRASSGSRGIVSEMGEVQFVLGEPKLMTLKELSANAPDAIRVQGTLRSQILTQGYDPLSKTGLKAVSTNTQLARQSGVQTTTAVDAYFNPQSFESQLQSGIFASNVDTALSLRRTTQLNDKITITQNLIRDIDDVSLSFRQQDLFIGNVQGVTRPKSSSGMTRGRTRTGFEQLEYSPAPLNQLTGQMNPALRGFEIKTFNLPQGTGKQLLIFDAPISKGVQTAEFWKPNPSFSFGGLGSNIEDYNKVVIDLTSGKVLKKGKKKPKQTPLTQNPDAFTGVTTSGGQGQVQVLEMKPETITVTLQQPQQKQKTKSKQKVKMKQRTRQQNTVADSFKVSQAPPQQVFVFDRATGQVTSESVAQAFRQRQLRRTKSAVRNSFALAFGLNSKSAFASGLKQNQTTATGTAQTQRFSSASLVDSVTRTTAKTSTATASQFGFTGTQAQALPIPFGTSRTRVGRGKKDDKKKRKLPKFKPFDDVFKIPKQKRSKNVSLGYTQSFVTAGLDLRGNLSKRERRFNALTGLGLRL